MEKVLEDDRISLLIEVIQNYDFLYDLSHKDYKNSVKKEQAWMEISEILSCSVEDFKRYWRNVRDRFTKEKRGKPSGSGAEESNWPYFYKMLFYNKFTRPRKTHTTTAVAESQAKAESWPSSSCSSGASLWSSVDVVMSPVVSPYSEGPPEEVEQTIMADASVTVDVDDDDAAPYLETPKASKASASASAGKKRKTDDDLKVVLSVAQRIAKTMEQKRAKFDVNGTFVECIYSRLSEMSPEEAKRQRKTMLQILENDEQLCNQI